jgi:hypothetical protein
MSEENFINEIRDELALMPIRRQPKKARDVVVALEAEITELLEKGAGLEDIFMVIRKSTPDRIRMTYPTFKKYCQEMRSAKGIPKNPSKTDRKKDASSPLKGKSKRQITTRSQAKTDTDTEGFLDREDLLREIELDLEAEYGENAKT